MSTHQFLFCSLKDCINFHPENNSNDFIVKLPKTLHLDGDWECALLDVTFENPTPGRSKMINILTDLCDSSHINFQNLPILRRLLLHEGSYEFKQPFYIRIARDQIQRFRIYITYDQDSGSTLSMRTLYCTLNLRKCLGNLLYQM